MSKWESVVVRLAVLIDLQKEATKFYRFPLDPNRRRWVAALNRKDWQPLQYLWLCSQHFVTGELLIISSGAHALLIVKRLIYILKEYTNS